MSKKETQEQKALKRLQSEKSAEIIKGLTDLRKHGKHGSIRPVVELLADTKDEEVRSHAMKFLCDLRQEEALEPLVDCITDEAFDHIRKELLEALWQSNLDASDYLMDLIGVVPSMTYNELIELMTVMDNLEGPFNSSDLDECVGVLSVELGMVEDEQHGNMLLVIQEIIGTLPVEQ